MGAQAVRLSNVDINNALENKDFEVLFQPIFDLSNGALARMETFVRWRHPSLGVLPPGAFISFFESQGRMGELTRYVLDNALESYSGWRGPYAPGFSINLSLADLTDDAFTSHLMSLVQSHDFPADLITLECPMPAVDSDLEDMADRFAQLRKTGARLAIEVRGRANDFLRTVDPFPFDEIKTGGSSILRFARTVRGPGLSAISDLLDIAKKANAITTAVGVEDQASLSALRGLGFTAAQGNHLAKVGNLNEFRPGQVNHVRELLELPPLNGDELAALFRTSAPELQASEISETPVPALTNADEPVETPSQDQKSDAVEIVPPTSEQDKDALRARARKKAKAIALAKRAKARDARKAAAIKRAKAKVALAKQQAGAATVSDEGAAPRAMQDRIAQEFSETEGAAAPNSEETASAPMEHAAAATTENVGAQPGEPLEAPVDTAAATDAGSPTSMEIKMPISDARAYFRPGVSVRGVPTSLEAEPFDVAPEGGETQTTNDAAATAPDIAFEDEHDVSVHADDHKAELTEAAQPDASVPAPEIATASADQEEADPMMDDDHDDDARLPRSHKRKNFLTRKYKVVPTHFWPKPWTRALRRRRAASEEASAEV